MSQGRGHWEYVSGTQGSLYNKCECVCVCVYVRAQAFMCMCIDEPVHNTRIL